MSTSKSSSAMKGAPSTSQWDCVWNVCFGCTISHSWSTHTSSWLVWPSPLPALGSVHTEMVGSAGPFHSFECFLVLKWLVWLDPLTVLNDFSIEMAGWAGPSHSFEWFSILKWLIWLDQLLVWLDPLTVLNDLYVEWQVGLDRCFVSAVHLSKINFWNHWDTAAHLPWAY